MEPRIYKSFVAASRSFFRRHWQAALHWREKFTLQEEALHLLLAALVGVIGGAVNLFFFYAGEMVQRLFLPQPIDPVQAAEMFAPWQRLAVPTLGGLVAGLILYWGFQLVGPQGSSDLLEVVVAGDGRLPFRTESVKTASALVSIATGASIGREGGITQLSATLASKLGQIARWPPYRLRLLVGCGAAAGISAAYNAPIAGAVFASLIVLGNFSMNLFAPLVCASVVATMVSRSFFGIEPWYHVPPFPPTAPAQLPWFIVLGILCGGVSALFMKFLRAAKENFNHFDLPIYVRLALAGLAVGMMAAIGFPGVCGNGYFVTNAILHGDFETASAFPQLGGLFLAKLLATGITVGAGTVGGVFTPTMFLGADAGALFGMTLHHFGCATGVPSGAFALVGMGATLAGTTKSPLLAMIMAFEISLDYSLMPPLMLACVVAVLVARQLHGESVYTEHLRNHNDTRSQCFAKRPDDAALYQHGRAGRDFTYAIPVEPGLYTLRLKFAETTYPWSFERPFNLNINGRRVLDNFDICHAARGPNKAYERTFRNLLPTKKENSCSGSPADLNLCRRRTRPSSRPSRYFPRQGRRFVSTLGPKESSSIGTAHLDRRCVFRWWNHYSV